MRIAILALIGVGGWALFVAGSPVPSDAQQPEPPKPQRVRSIVDPGEVGEAGFLAIPQGKQGQWTPLHFERTYNDPVVLLSIQSAMGANENGMADWLEHSLASANGIDDQPSSLVSPACIEGDADFAQEVALTADGEVIEVFDGIDGQWFANVPLRSEGFTSVSASFENGAQSESIEIEWAVTRVAEHENMMIRIGDSLKLGTDSGQDGLVSNDQAASRLISVIDTATGEMDTEEKAGSDRYVIHTFDEAGVFEVRVSRSNGEILHSMELSVVAPDFGPPADALVDAFRVWNIPEVPWSLHAESDPMMAYIEIPDFSQPRWAFVAVGNVGRTHVLARLSPDGPIAARGTVNAFDIASVADTHANEIIEQFENGDRLIEADIALVGELPDGWYLEIGIRASGVTFDDGTRIRHLYASDFDESGIARFRMNLPEGAKTKDCHYIAVYDDDGNFMGSL